jgi:hypothetical protein
MWLLMADAWRRPAEAQEKAAVDPDALPMLALASKEP